MQGNFVWSPDEDVDFEPLAPAPDRFRALAEAGIDDAVAGKLVE